MPEGRIIMSQTAIYLATSGKSNSAYEAIGRAQQIVTETGNLPVPLHLRNAPTALMKQLDYGKDYQYAHAHKANFVVQEYLPQSISGQQLYLPQQNAQEIEVAERLKKLWQEHYGY